MTASIPGRRPRAPRLIALGAGVLSLGLILSGCGTDPLADQYRNADNKNYIAGDGTVTEIGVSEREGPVSYEGVSETGETISSEDYLGEVVVVNFWYAGCAPCRAEAPDLQSISEEFAGKGASMLGVNVYDQPDTALSFNKTYGVTYPSIMDIQDGAVKLAFTGQVRPNAVPTTLVIDKEGRVAARVLGQLTERSILQTIVRDTIAE